jgi:hypothetical protein
VRDLIVTENISLDCVLDGDLYVLAGEGSDTGDVGSGRHPPVNGGRDDVD